MLLSANARWLVLRQNKSDLILESFLVDRLSNLVIYCLAVGLDLFFFLPLPPLLLLWPQRVMLDQRHTAGHITAVGFVSTQIASISICSTAFGGRERTVDGSGTWDTIGAHQCLSQSIIHHHSVMCEVIFVYMMVSAIYTDSKLSLCSCSENPRFMSKLLTYSRSKKIRH